MTHATIFGGSLGILPNARLELPYQCVSKAKSRVKTSQRERSCDYIVSRVQYIFNVLTVLFVLCTFNPNNTRQE